jgi:hypothetical protein
MLQRRRGASLARARSARAAVDSSRVTELTSARRRLLCRQFGAKGLACGHQFRHLEAVSLDGDVDTIATDLTNQALE